MGSLPCCKIRMFHAKFLFVFLLVAFALARNPKDRYGILYVNEITANIDTFTVQIEDAFVEDNILRIDILEEWTGNGIFSENVFMKDGDAITLDYFLVYPNTTFPGELYAHGGILADSAIEFPRDTRNAPPPGSEDFYSFIVEDDTGSMTVRGLLYVDEGIFVNNDAFTIAGGSGDTTVKNAKLNADGGIDVSDGLFTTNPITGDIFVDNSLHVLGTYILGTNEPEDRFIRRLPTFAREGGDTVFQAQDGTVTGGDLILNPGWETSCVDQCNDGSIFLGPNTNDNIRVIRPTTLAAGARTTYLGQQSPNGDGGDLVFAAGDSTAAGNGGNLIVIPGFSANANHGRIYFGTDQGTFNYPLAIQRPAIATGNGGDTFFVGQSTQNGNAGNLNILAGQGTNGGVLRIIPGDADQDSGDREEQADIILGNPDNHLLRITRSVANNNAGVSIFVGDLVDDLTITREARFGGGLDTYIMGQESAATQGGDLFFLGGNGQDIGGDVRVVGGLSLGADSNAQSVGGGIIIESGNGQINGGNINIYGGSGTTAGGSVLITTDSTGASGDIYLSAGSGPTMGDITIGDEALLFTLDGDL